MRFCHWQRPIPRRILRCRRKMHRPKRRKPHPKMPRQRKITPIAAPARTARRNQWPMRLPRKVRRFPLPNIPLIRAAKQKQRIPWRKSLPHNHLSTAPRSGRCPSRPARMPTRHHRRTRLCALIASRNLPNGQHRATAPVNRKPNRFPKPVPRRAPGPPKMRPPRTSHKPPTVRPVPRRQLWRSMQRGQRCRRIPGSHLSHCGAQSPCPRPIWGRGWQTGRLVTQATSPPFRLRHPLHRPQRQRRQSARPLRPKPPIPFG